MRQSFERLFERNGSQRSGSLQRTINPISSGRVPIMKRARLPCDMDSQRAKSPQKVPRSHDQFIGAVHTAQKLPYILGEIQI